MLEQLVQPVLEFIKFEFRIVGQFSFWWVLFVLVLFLAFLVIKTYLPGNKYGKYGK